MPVNSGESDLSGRQFPPYMSYWRFLLYLTVAGGLSELVVMTLVLKLPFLTALEDAILTIIIVYPIIFLGLLRPFRKLCKERQKIQDEMYRSQQELELRVQERTEALRLANESLRQEIINKETIEADLATKRAKMQFFLSQVPAIAWSTDKEQNVTYAAGAGLKAFHQSLDEPIENHLPEVVQSNLVFLEKQKNAIEGRASLFETVIADRTYQVHLEPFSDEDGEITGSIGLALDISALKEAESRLELQSAALNTAANGIFISDCDGVIQWANQALADMTGYTLDELLGQSPQLFKSGLHDSDFYQQLWQTIITGNVWQGEITNRRKDGSLYVEEQTITPVKRGTGEITHYIAIKQDITERVQDQLKVKQRNQELQRLNKFARVASSILNEEHILQSICQIFKEDPKISAGRVYLLRTDDMQLHLQAWWGRRYEVLSGEESIPLDSYPKQTVVQEQRVVVERTPCGDGMSLGIIQKSSSDECIDRIWMPLTAHSQFLGVLEIIKEISVLDEPEDRHFYDLMGGQIGIALQNARFYQAEMDAHLLAESLREASIAISHGLNQNTIYHTLLNYFERMVGYDSALIIRLDSEEEYIVRIVSHGPERDDTLMVDLPSIPTLQVLVQCGVNQTVTDTQVYLADRWFYESHNMRSLISLPIKVDGRVQAVCILGKNEPGYYTNTHIHLVEALIGQAGVALQNAWLFDQVSAGHERLLNLSRQLVSVQEDERAYVSRELHDQTSQSMAAMLVELDLLSRSAESPETITEAVTRLEALVSQVMYDLHNIAIKLRPASLDHTGLVEAIRQYVSAFEKKYSHTAQFETFGMPFDLPEETNITLFRILQESLTNVLRHAKATRADVVLEYHSDHVTLLIEDNGVGFETRMRTNGIHLGLTGMRERVAMVQGDLLIESTPGEGTIIKVTIPLNELWSQREQDQSGIEVEM